MIVEIFFGLMAASFLLLFYGYYSRADAPRLIGFTFLFILGAVVAPLFPGSIEYESGKTINTINATHTTETITYNDYTDHTIGFWLMIIGILGFTIVMVDRRKEGGEFDDDD